MVAVKNSSIPTKTEVKFSSSSPSSLGKKVFRTEDLMKALFVFIDDQGNKGDGEVQRDELLTMARHHTNDNADEKALTSLWNVVSGNEAKRASVNSDDFVAQCMKEVKASSPNRDVLKALFIIMDRNEDNALHEAEFNAVLNGVFEGWFGINESKRSINEEEFVDALVKHASKYPDYLNTILYDTLDKDLSGTIGKDEIPEALFTMLKGDSNGNTIAREEVVTFFKSIRENDEGRDRARLVFQAIDNDKSGQIERHEIRLTDVKHAMNAVDKDQNGSIDFNEFIEMLKGQNHHEVRLAPSEPQTQTPSQSSTTTILGTIWSGLSTAFTFIKNCLVKVWTWIKGLFA